MEVVVLSITDDEKSADNVDECCSGISPPISFSAIAALS